MDKRLRALVFERSGGYCEFCCRSLSDSWALHHRQLKSQGGKDVPENLVAVHHECHNLGTNSIHLNPKMAKERGYIVPSWDNPEHVAICPQDGIKVRLFNNGTKQIEQEEQWQENQQSHSWDESR